MFKLKRRQQPATEQFNIPQSLRELLAKWLMEHGHNDPAATIERGWLVDLAIDLHTTTADRDALVAALKRTTIPQRFTVTKIPLNLTAYLIRLGLDGLLVPGNPFEKEGIECQQ